MKALTGPVQRGDVLSLMGHVQALDRAPKSVRGLYRSAGLHALDMAERRGLPADTARQVRMILGACGGRDD